MVDLGQRQRLAQFVALPATPLPRLEGNLDLCVATRRRESHSSGDSLGMLPDERPPAGTCQDNDGDAACLQVLLVADAPVGREQQLEPCRLGGVQERPLLSVSQPFDCAV